MEWGVHKILEFGQLATPVIALAVIIILLFSVADRHPRDDDHTHKR